MISGTPNTAGAINIVRPAELAAVEPALARTLGAISAASASGPPNEITANARNDQEPSGRDAAAGGPPADAHSRALACLRLKMSSPGVVVTAATLADSAATVGGHDQGRRESGILPGARARR